MGSTPPPPTLVPGQLLDRYELLCPVAQGGMAQVWVARLQGKLGFEKLVAIKTMIAEHAHDDKFEKMFLDEANIIARIRHPNVAQILDLGHQGSVIFLVLEWIEGESAAALRRAVHSKGEKMPLNVVLRVVADACAGLHAAHELKNERGEPLNVVHRDVSPSNVLLSVSGEVKLIDFGVAKAVDRIAPETAAGVIKGKVAYMSPEQALGKAVDRRADIWSAGIMLYHLLAGRTPYEGDNQIQTLHQVVQGLPPEPIKGIPPEVAEIAYTALSYAADGRYATADEMQRAVEAALVKCCGPTTQSDVATYVNSKMSERVARRRRTIQRALEAAEQRKQLAHEFESAIEQSSSSMYAALELKTPSSLQGFTRSEASSDAEIDALIGDENAPRAQAPAPLEIPAADTESPAFSDAPTLKKPPTNLPDIPMPASVAKAPGPLPPIPRPPASDRPPPAATGTDAPLPPIPREAPVDSESGPSRQAKTAPKIVLPPPTVITEVQDATSPRQFQSIPDTSKFGTRRRGPLIFVGFAAALLVLGYGAYLAWDKVTTERGMAPSGP
ncbi:MAG: protein kinase [Polyangiaceae bacterium]|nr:protein kinase [Polyangiaceae bacterium]MCL4754849.1 protein kinase [Myxococcales bacterium]